MTPRTVINRIDFVGREDVQFTVSCVTSTSGERVAKQSFVLRELFREHLVPESRNDRYALRTTLCEIVMYVRVIQMLVDICHDNPVGNATTSSPVGLLKCEVGPKPGVRIAIWGHWPQFDLGIETQNLLGIVGRCIIVDDVPLNEFVIMQKKEGQHVSLVPAARIEVYLHEYLWTPPNKRPKDLIAFLVIHFSARSGLHTHASLVVQKAEEVEGEA